MQVGEPAETGRSPARHACRVIGRRHDGNGWMRDRGRPCQALGQVTASPGSPSESESKRRCCLGKGSERLIVAKRLHESGAIPRRRGTPCSGRRRGRSLAMRRTQFTCKETATAARGREVISAGRTVSHIAHCARRRHLVADSDGHLQAPLRNPQERLAMSLSLNVSA